MKVNISKEGRFIPEWEGNRDLPESEQVVVEYTALTGEQRKKYTHKEKPLYTVEVEGKTEDEIEEQIQDQTRKVELRIWTDDDKIAAASNIRIGNLEDTDGDPLDTWDKILKAPHTKENQLSVLVTEVESELGTLAKETDTKN